MRLIVEDALAMVKFHGYPEIEITPSDVNAEAYKRGWNDAIDAIIVCTPTIDAVPVKHGRWKEVSDDMYAGGGAWICSSCHYGFSWKAYSLLPEEKYCPHCGARMDGDTYETD